MYFVHESFLTFSLLVDMVFQMDHLFVEYHGWSANEGCVHENDLLLHLAFLVCCWRTVGCYTPGQDFSYLLFYAVDWVPVGKCDLFNAVEFDVKIYDDEHTRIAWCIIPGKRFYSTVAEQETTFAASIPRKLVSGFL